MIPDRQISIIQEKLETLTGERANGSRRAVLIADLLAALSPIEGRVKSLESALSSESNPADNITQDSVASADISEIETRLEDAETAIILANQRITAAAASIGVLQLAQQSNGGKVFVQQARPIEPGPWAWWVKDASGRVVNLILNDGAP